MAATFASAASRAKLHLGRWWQFCVFKPPFGRHVQIHITSSSERKCKNRSSFLEGGREADSQASKRASECVRRRAEINRCVCLSRAASVSPPPFSADYLSLEEAGTCSLGSLFLPQRGLARKRRRANCRICCVASLLSNNSRPVWRLTYNCCLFFLRRRCHIIAD